MPKSAEIQNLINAKNAEIDAEAQKAESTDHGKIIQLRNEISILEMQLSDAKAEEAQQSERVQAQTEKVESITLPLDFNDLLDNPLANEMVIEVVKQFQLQAYEEHNVEVVRINADWNSKFDDMKNLCQSNYADLLKTHEESQDELMAEVDANYTLNVENESLSHKLKQALTDQKDAESKRDNAVNELEQAKAEIDRLNNHVFELQQQIASAPAPRAAIDITPNDRLNNLAKQAKESIVEKANRGLARWNLPAIEVPSMPEAQPLAMPEIPAAQEEHPKDEVSDGNTEGNPTVEGNTAIPQSLGENAKPAEETLTLDSLKAEIDALKTAHGARLDRLDKQANLPEVA
jgi:regulator of replication initiation timing